MNIEKEINEQNIILNNVNNIETTNVEEFENNEQVKEITIIIILLNNLINRIFFLNLQKLLKKF